MHEFHIDYGPICKIYAQKQLTGTLYLAFRDVPQLLNHYSLLNKEYSMKVLDFGCGTGASTRYLKSLRGLFKNGLEVQGVDISSNMLNLACEADPKGTYHLLQQHRIPVIDNFYDFVFSSFVLFEFASKKQMQKALEEIKRVMKKNAIFIAVTGSAEAYHKQNRWVSLNVDFPQNDNLQSGDLGRIDFIVNDNILTFQNYYWTEKDYEEVFQQAGLHLLESLHPLGYKEEERNLSWHWQSETKVSPYYIFVLSS